MSISFIEAQENFTINGKRITLQTEVDGKLDLLWSLNNRKYRYFVRTDKDSLIELKNTIPNNALQNDYKTVLDSLTNGAIATQQLKFKLPSLKTVLDQYNSSVDVDYTPMIPPKKLQFRLGGFAGITNSPFITNNDNLTTALFGGELEVLDYKQLSRHAFFLQIKHVRKQEELQYSTTEIALGYRFRMINKRSYSLYANMKFATVNFTNATVTITNSDASIFTEKLNQTTFDIPLIFGIGADIKITENSFITLAYNELFAVFLKNKGNFSQDFAIGYKFNLQ